MNEQLTDALFSWVPFYEELANRLVEWKERQPQLVELLNRLREEGQPVMSLADKNAAGEQIILNEIDPFTVFALFNRGMTDTNRGLLAAALGQALGVSAIPPKAFAGIPVVNNQRTWFLRYAYNRQTTNVPNLWAVFEQAIASDPLDSEAFASAFDAALTVAGVRFSLTTGLFWARPTKFASLDGAVRKYAKLRISSAELNASRYVSILRDLAERVESFPQLSYDAWLEGEEPASDPEEGLANSLNARPAAELDDVDFDTDQAPVFWFVGARWGDEDQTDRFISEGVWENGYTDKLLDKVRSMRPGERIAIKASYVRKHNLPFDNKSKFASIMSIKAVGTILENAGDGRRIKVRWQPKLVPPREWYFYTNQGTVWGIKRKRKPYNDFLIDFAFRGQDQNYAWFLSQPWWAKRLEQAELSGIVEPEPQQKADEELAVAPIGLKNYAVDDVINEGVFLARAEIEDLVQLLRTQKNLILQGPPGVGKTFLAKKIAFALLGTRDETRVTRIQFHQSMSYEDFVRGLRPLPRSQEFGVVDGPFLDVAEAARVSPDDQDFVLIVEEINRGNPSAIFGELLTLLEPDKRDPENAIRLTHRRDGELPFYVPPNMYLIGTLNLADRSLATLDYALRRRFAFQTLIPNFGDPFLAWCERHGASQAFAKQIASKVTELNRTISSDPTLGAEYTIGHSYFCPRDGEIEGRGQELWFRKVVEKQIIPLLDQYWFDNVKQTAAMRAMLLDGVK